METAGDQHNNELKLHPNQIQLNLEFLVFTVIFTSIYYVFA